MAKAKGAKKKAAAKAKPKVKAKAKKPAPAKKTVVAKKAVVAKPVADNGLAKRVAALESAIASLKKGSGGSGDSVAKAIDVAASEIRQRAEDADHVAMAEVRKHVDKVTAELAAADENLRSEIGAVAAQGEMKMDDIQALRRRVDELEARLDAKK